MFPCLNACFACIRRQVRVSNPKLFIFLKQVGEVSQDTVGDWDRLMRGCQIQHSKKTAALNYIKTCVDKFTSGVYTLYEFFICSQTYMDSTIRTV